MGSRGWCWGKEGAPFVLPRPHRRRRPFSLRPLHGSSHDQRKVYIYAHSLDLLGGRGWWVRERQKTATNLSPPPVPAVRGRPTPDDVGDPHVGRSEDDE